VDDSDWVDRAFVVTVLSQLTIGSAPIDAPVARLSEDERRALYAGWLREFAALDPTGYAQTPAHASHLYAADDAPELRDMRVV
jgi:hypothetical protein